MKSSAPSPSFFESNGYGRLVFIEMNQTRNLGHSHSHSPPQPNHWGLNQAVQDLGSSSSRRRSCKSPLLDIIDLWSYPTDRIYVQGNFQSQHGPHKTHSRSCLRRGPRLRQHWFQWGCLHPKWMTRLETCHERRNPNYWSDSRMSFASSLEAAGDCRQSARLKTL